MSETQNHRVFEKRTVFNTTLEKMEAFHQDRAALGTLTPPPIFVQLHHDGRTSLTEGDLDFTLWFAFIPIRWLARHEAVPGQHGFAEWQVKGPMGYWRHEHLFCPKFQHRARQWHGAVRSNRGPRTKAMQKNRTP